MPQGHPKRIGDSYFAARDASLEEAAAWKARIAANPMDMEARESWIGWNFAHDMHAFLSGTEYREQVAWLVANAPGSFLLGMIGSYSSTLQPGLYAQLRGLWNSTLARCSGELAALNHAADFFSHREPDRALELLEMAQRLAPEDPSQELRLSQDWLRRSRRTRGRNTTRPYSVENDFDPACARAALEHAVRAVALNRDEWFAAHMEVQCVEAVVGTGDWRRAEQLGLGLLKRVSSNPGMRDLYGDETFHAHRVLGHAAIRRGDVAAAKRHLLSCCSGGTSPVLSSFGPDWSLARELLEHGESECVLEFLALCRSIWRDHDGQLERWMEQIRRGGNCAFSR